MEKLDIRPIKGIEDHGVAMQHIDTLMSLDDLSEDQVRDLEVLSILVERYESEHFPVKLPTPVDAIEFRIDQLDLTRSQLAELIGFPKSRVSEVLNGKRSPSLDMMRALHEKLNIPADVLLGKAKAKLPQPCPDVEWKSFPILEMFKLGWIGDVKPKVDEIEARIQNLMSAAMVQTPQFAGIRFRGAESKEPNPYSVNAWLMKAMGDAIECESEYDFDADNVGHCFRREIAKLSLYSDGPKRAFQKLNKVGVTAVYVPFLKKTHIDGACFSLPSGKPAIAVSLRHHRLDNFWFTLLHECVHVERHLPEAGIILDETEGQTGAFGNDPDMENEANTLARSALIPDDIREELSRVAGSISKAKVQTYARRADVHAAVIAGQVRHMTGRYTHFGGLVGQGEVAQGLGCVRP
ncbi:helix-turn-helix domain-containing protein [Lentibacter algarum]|uniref:helix-turn-helix domain-containing protein n=1 Tax=Lentibacter algarum TaxID=576131 RepID=UPI0023029619|nr:helix-turn-helix domain-containing protein [Lentibacter algarum]